jgi:hypothetical protein
VNFPIIIAQVALPSVALSVTFGADVGTAVLGGFVTVVIGSVVIGSVVIGSVVIGCVVVGFSVVVGLSSLHSSTSVKRNIFLYIFTVY